jgi:hypothetical protein
MIVTVDVPYEIDEELVLTVQDCQFAGNCNMGARSYFLRQGLSWSKFVTKGLKTGEFPVFDEHIRGPYENALKRIGK